MQKGKYVILCVDDDEDILASLRVILEANGYVITTANSAAEGYKRYQELKPDLVIVDLMMEKIDSGISLAQQICATGNRTPIYMLSSTGDNLASLTDYSELGLSGVFQKPLSMGELLSLLKQKLQG